MEEYLEIDDILVKIGQFGLYQKVLETVVCLSYFAGIYQIFLPYFVTYNPAWRCVFNSSQCSLNGSFTYGQKNYEARCGIPRNQWEYVQEKEYSVVTEFDLFCDKEDLKYIDTSLFFVTWAIGSVIFGWMADRYGRRRIILISAWVITITSFVSAFSPAYWFYVLSRAVIGLFSPGYLIMPFIYLSEIVGPKFRPLMGIMLFVVSSLAIGAVGLQAFYIRKWRTLLMVCSAPYLPLCVFFYFIPESIRWLRINNKISELNGVLSNIAKWNKRRIPENIRVKEIDKTAHKEVTPLDVFRPRAMLFKSLALGFAWLANSMVYFGIALAADNLGGSMYRDYILSALVGLIGDLTSIVVATRFGRKKSVLIPMFTSAVACIVAAIIPLGKTQALDAIRLTFGLLGKFCIQISFDVIYTWSVELYPTVVRSEGIGWLQVTSRIGGALAPWVSRWLKVFHIVLPFAIMGGTCLVSAVFLTYLPETKEQPTAEMLEETPKKAEINAAFVLQTDDTAL